MTVYKRSDWTTSKTQCYAPFGAVKGVAIHYPGGNIPDLVAQGDMRATAAYLDGVRSAQMNSTKYSYCDIEYSLGVDRKGNIWRLRGLRHRTGANGTSAANETHPSIFVIVGLTKNEKPTRAQKRGIRQAIKMVRAKYPSATEIRGHREFVATACPGQPLWNLIQKGALEPRDEVLEKLKARLEKVGGRLGSIRQRIKKLKALQDKLAVTRKNIRARIRKRS